MNKIIKRHSDGSVTTLGETLTAVSKGALMGIGAATVIVLTGTGLAYLSVKSNEDKN